MVKEEDEVEGVEPEQEDDIYEEEERQKEEENDQISPSEEAFMEGYDEDEKVAECATCKKPLLTMKSTIEREIGGKHVRFCSVKCSDSYRQK